MEYVSRVLALIAVGFVGVLWLTLAACADTNWWPKFDRDNQKELAKAKKAGASKAQLEKMEWHLYH